MQKYQKIREKCRLFPFFKNIMIESSFFGAPVYGKKRRRPEEKILQLIAPASREVSRQQSKKNSYRNIKISYPFDSSL
jgi:hypothetical protein